MESGVNMEGGPDSKLMINVSGDIGKVAGAEAGAGSAMVSMMADVGVDVQLMVPGALVLMQTWWGRNEWRRLQDWFCLHVWL